MNDVARVYAEALFSVGENHDKLDTLQEQLAQFAEALEENSEMETYFFSPYFSSQEKADGISRVLDDPDEHFERFLRLLAERHRLPAIPRIRREFERRWREHKNLLSVHVKSAIELDQETVDGIGKRVEDQTGRDVELTSEVDPDILGGLVIRVGNRIYDSSIRSRLERVRREVARAA